METCFYSEIATPPAFGQMLPGAIGYISKCGQTVFYGESPFQRLMRTGWGGAPAIQSRIPEATVIVIPMSGSPVMASDVLDNPITTKTGRKPLSARFKQCSICRDTTILSRHHTRPSVRGEKRKGPVIRICRPCHVQIHLLFTNEELHHTKWETVVETVRTV